MQEKAGETISVALTGGVYKGGEGLKTGCSGGGSVSISLMCSVQTFYYLCWQVLDVAAGVDLSARLCACLVASNVAETDLKLHGTGDQI